MIVPTFDTMPTSQWKMFDINSYKATNTLQLLRGLMLDMYQKAENAAPTQFHLLMAAYNGYTLKILTE
jgi:hypothetical protein